MRAMFSLQNPRFNSQRDGILLNHQQNHPKENQVSIPNGMEFYQNTLTPRTSKKECFNSQRDGILQFQGFIMYDFIDCFNSQRDGILHSFQCHRNWLWYVSIPNGMEFYQCCVNFIFGRYEFQFPTGWNSTRQT